MTNVCMLQRAYIRNHYISTLCALWILRNMLPHRHCYLRKTTRRRSPQTETSWKLAQLLTMSLLACAEREIKGSRCIRHICSACLWGMVGVVVRIARAYALRLFWGFTFDKHN